MPKTIDTFGDAEVETVGEFGDTVETTNDGGFANELGAALGGNLGEFLTALDMTKVKDGFSLIAHNTICLFNIKKVEAVKTAKKDNMLKLTLECVLPEEFAGTKVWDNVVLVPASLWKFKSLAKATDLADASGNFIGDNEQSFVDKQLVASVTESFYFKKEDIEKQNKIMKNEINGGYKHPSEYDGSDSSAPQFA